MIYRKRGRRLADASIDIQPLGPGRLACGVEGDLFDARLGLAQEFFASPLQALAALVDCNRLLERHFPFLESLHDRLELLDRALEGQALDVAIVIFSHACFRLSANRDQQSSEFGAKV